MPIWQGRDVETATDKGYELMANPSLKAQIEAAKSALANDLAAPSLVVPPPKPPMATTTPIMVGNDIATGTAANTTNAATLDERITRLEAKLLDNQRDLHTLLQKIREVSRLQTNSGQTHKNRANDQAETMVIDEAKNKAGPRRSQRSPVIMVAMAALIGLVFGIAYFLVTAKGDLSALTVPSWIPTIIDRFNGWVG
jgi:hypothetical protein